jgi:hypothetical protein
MVQSMARISRAKVSASHATLDPDRACSAAQDGALSLSKAAIRASWGALQKPRENEQSSAVALKKRMVALPTSRCLICASSSHGAIPITYQGAECGLPDISPP